MSVFLWNIMLALMWGMATGQFDVANLTLGFVIGYFILRFAQRAVGPSVYFVKVRLAIRFALFYFWQLILANFRVAYDVLVPGAWPSDQPSAARRERGYIPLTDPVGGDFPDSLRAPLATESYVCPGVIAIPLEVRTDIEISLLANLITLTPGSVSLDLSEDRRTLYIHAMYIDGGDVEAYRRNVKEGLERRVLELLR